MTNWAPDFTQRVLIHYTSAGVPHTQTIRYARGTAAGLAVADAITTFQGEADALDTILCDDFSITAIDFIDEDENVSVPVSGPFPGVAGAVPIGGFSTQDKATFLRFPGKSNGGLKTSLTIFGVNLSMDSTVITGQTYGRILAADSAPVADVITALTRSTLVANDNRPVTWYQYCTCKVSSYWWRQARKTGGL